jgi:hypothetical protein
MASAAEGRSNGRSNKKGDQQPLLAAESLLRRGARFDGMLAPLCTGVSVVET